MYSKLVSVIIPNYNSSKFIRETLNCVFNQTYDNIEILIVDDGSTDGSFELISGIDDHKIILVKNPKKGACAARNFGLSMSNGDYIQFLDADDLIDENKIENQVRLLDINKNKVAVCSTKHFTDTKDAGIITDKKFLFSTDRPQDFLLNLYGGDGIHQNMVAQHAWLVPKKVIDQAGRWDESLIKDQDGEFFCRVLMASEGICYDDKSLCYYRKHGQAGSISSGNSEDHLLSQLQSLYSKSRQLLTENHTKAYRNAMALQYKMIAIDAFPEHRAVYKIANTKMKDYGGSEYEPILGGKIVEMIKFIFGWKIARGFKYYLQRSLFSKKRK